MKKLLIAMAALMTLAFVGCEKEEEPATDALTGTTWASSYGGTPLAVSFNAGGIVTLNMGSETYTGTYTYNAPNVAIQMPIDGRNVAFTGTYSNGALNISSSEYGSFVFTQTGGPSPDGSDEADNPDNQPEMKYVKRIKETYTSDLGTEVGYAELEYDDQKRVVKVREYNEAGYGHDYTFSYNGNRLTVHKAYGEEYTAVLDSNGNIVSIDNWEYYAYDENGYLIHRHDVHENETFTWNDGNLVVYDAVYADDTESRTIAFTYDESLTFVPTNLNLFHTRATYIIDHDDYWLVQYGGWWGKQSKNIPIKIEVTRKNENDSRTFTEEFGCELNEDGSVSKIMRPNYTYEIIYY